MGNSGSNLTKELTEKNLDFLVGQTGLPREDIESILKIFNANESGSLDKKGFIRLFDEVNCLKEKKSYSTFRDEYTVSDFYKNFDRNNNGKITFNEFMLAYAIWNGGNIDIDSKLESAFGFYDSNSDDFLDSNEVKAVLLGTLNILGAFKKNFDQKGAEKITAEVMRDLDTNNDGKIAKREFIAGLSKNTDLLKFMDPYAVGGLSIKD